MKFFFFFPKKWFPQNRTALLLALLWLLYIYIYSHIHFTLHKMPSAWVKSLPMSTISAFLCLINIYIYCYNQLLFSHLCTEVYSNRWKSKSLHSSYGQPDYLVNHYSMLMCSCYLLSLVGYKAMRIRYWMKIEIITW